MNINEANKNIILFGCGEIGYEVLYMLGVHNVLCFCDNNQALWNTGRWGKQVFSLEWVKEKYDNYLIIICAKLAKAYYIAEQLDKEGIEDYWFYPMIEQDVKKLSQDEILEFLFDRDVMLRMRIKSYQDKISELAEQLDYMKGHADICSMKPAVGALRKRQLAYADLGEFFCKAVGGLGIKPFLCGGNLLGYVRNGGFIPWDDDMDFNLIRKDYEALRQYCLTKQDEEGNIPFHYAGKTEKLKFYEHYKMYGLLKKVENEPVLSMDFFSLDYYMDDYPFASLRADAKRIQTEAYNLSTREERIDFVRDEREKNPNVVEKSNSIFYGFDNMESIRPYDIGKMIPENVVFPLRKIKFEGKEFWAPNQPEQYLRYNFKDIWSFPDDVGLQRHI